MNSSEKGKIIKLITDSKISADEKIVLIEKFLDMSEPNLIIREVPVPCDRDHYPIYIPYIPTAPYPEPWYPDYTPIITYTGDPPIVPYTSICDNTIDNSAGAPQPWLIQ